MHHNQALELIRSRHLLCHKNASLGLALALPHQEETSPVLRLKGGGVSRAEMTTFPILHASTALGISLYAQREPAIFRLLAFHPYLIGKPAWEWWRSLSGFLLLGQTPVSSLVASYQLLTFESALDLEMKSTLNQPNLPGTLEEITHPNSPKSLLLRAKRALLTNKLIHANLISALTLIGIELLEYKFTKRGTYGQGFTPMATKLAYAHSFLMGMIAPKRVFKVMVFIPIKAALLPFLNCLLDRGETWKDLLKGMVAALATAYTLQLRRKDGKKAIDLLDVNRTIHIFNPFSA
ncbi:hypothetical protein K493DRAFT_337449 [Basidiobolus meristosporus CBS 931.73]|uniref:Uncharacterized protein n=1 Tax=Basidiobolus meristosporus CBS 931.73 TaxID=1314790 RepID=A0A1Y1YB50_9FUNG|nr:hypothetical protein K493DRAFT_9803 [Basidiobolus meristosporus CBS 931.73]ORX95240.1 hypothetical protein K493DRAFT_337449 [Basidiobolus meristosporus CBS 931.73]|eukprot:ORX64405.1 hypothetical protein K493DRAFT_9803 [Basidiobolus meristosporus CBS 931.73]